MSAARETRRAFHMTTLQDVVDIAQRDQYLAVVSTLRTDGMIQSSVVNAGVLPHPVTGTDVIGFVTYGATKLSNLRKRPRLSITFRSGWEWATAEGQVEVIGPDDPSPTISADRLRLLLREIFTAAGGSHDDWEEYDRTMTDQHRTAVLVCPTRIYSN